MSKELLESRASFIFESRVSRILFSKKFSKEKRKSLSRSIRGSNETELTVAKANLSPRNVGHHQTDEVVGNTRWKMANVNRKAKISFAEAH